VEFPTAVRTSVLALTVLKSTLRTNTDSVTGATQLLPVGMGEVRLLGVDAPVASAPDSIDVSCAAGISMSVDGAPVPLSVRASADAVLAGSEVAAQPCGDGSTTFRPGRHTVAMYSSPLAVPQSVSLTKTGTPPLSGDIPAVPGTSDVRSWGSTNRSVRVDVQAQVLLVVRENANAGWRASLHGRTLRPVTIDGWEQGWLLPAGASGIVQLTYTPQSVAEWGFLAGLLAALVLIGGALLPGTGGAATVRGRSWSRLGLVAVGATGLALLGGLAGLAVGAVAAAVVVQSHRVGRLMPRRLPAGLLGAAGAAGALRPAGSADPAAGSAWVQVICLLALGLGILALLAPAPPRTGEATQQRAFHQMPGNRRRSRRGERGEQIELEEVALEGPPTHPSL
jgi:arabinofuranan 3-O-arabinosyltransferase